MENVGDKRDITHDGKVKKEILEVRIFRFLNSLLYIRLEKASKGQGTTTYAMSLTKLTSTITN